MMIHDILLTHLSGKVICRMNSADKMFKTQGILMATSPCRNNTVGICSFAGNETRENHETDFKSVDGVHISLGRNSSADHSITHDNITTGLVVLGLPAFYLKGEASEESDSNYVSDKNSNNALKVFTGSEMPVNLDPKSFKGNDFTFFHEKSSYNKLNASETSTLPVRIKAEHLEMDDITYDCHLKGSGNFPVIENSRYVNQSSYLHNNFCAGVSQSNLLSVSRSLKVKPESVGSSQTHWKVSFCNSEGQTLENKMNLLGDFPVDIFDHIPLKYRLGTFELHHEHYRDIVDNVPLKYRLGTSEFHSDSPLDILDDVSLKYGYGTTASGVGFNSSIDNYLSENIYPVSSVSHSFESINTTVSYSSSRRKGETSSLTSDSHSFGSVDGKARFSVSRRKRKKTATDSVEKAMEEDAPGLLQVLLDRGIQVEEIKLYGDIEGEDSLEETSSEDNFEELESLMTKLFSERPSLLGFALRRSGKGSKTFYCLASLISLIEQCRYLLFRQTPVEWGWCRDLQSFIFVFKTHNRIVLERPEYGYATYFFEIVSSLPIDWQVKRLVMAMKLTNCSRTILLENKPLIVGEDLSEGEARVLGEYGWVPNTGIGTLLNYCDRVVHDRINEVHNCDWRAKIGKILKNGYDRGCLVLTNIPRKAAEYMQYQGTEVKLEP